MVDIAYNIPALPESAENLNHDGANAIEWNLYALVRAWPAFETLVVDDKVGTYDYLDTRDGETAAVSDGIVVDLIQYLPRLIVFYDGAGMENVSWSGFGWVEESPGMLVYQLGELSAANATEALAILIFSATGEADITITLAAENLLWEPDGLRLPGKTQTIMLFRDKATWGIVKAKKLTWGGAKPLTWGEAKNIRKGD